MAKNKISRRIKIVDAPTTVDLLGYDKFVRPVAEQIIKSRNSDTSLTIGVYGEWGSGKTSFLKMVEERLQESDENIKPIWFNAWKYDKEENLWAALIQTILEDITIVGERWRRPLVRFKVWRRNFDLHSGALSIFKQILPLTIRLVLVVLVIGLINEWGKLNISNFLIDLLVDPSDTELAETVSWLIKVFAVGLVSITMVPEAAVALFDKQLRLDFDKFRKKHGYREHIAFLDEFSSEFQNIIDMTSKGEPVVIVIDDLDRCMPEKAVQVLEAIKLFMDVKNCVFLLAVDREVVEKAILTKYQHLVKHIEQHSVSKNTLATFLGENYFEKIVQLSISLPPLSAEDIERFIKEISKGNEVLSDLAPIFAAGFPQNPRKIKRALLIFDFLFNVAGEKVDEGKVEPALLAKFIVIQLQHRDLYREIVDNPPILSGLEVYFEYQSKTLFVASDAEANEVDVIEQRDQALKELLPPNGVERVKKLVEVYASLGNLLLDGNGSFRSAELKDYIYLVSSIAEAPSEDYGSQPTGRETSESSLNAGALSFANISIQERNYLKVLRDQIRQQQRKSWTFNDQSHFVYFPPDFSPINQLDNAPEETKLGIKDIFENHSKILVVGEAGFGKTTLLQQLAKTHAEGYTLTWLNTLSFAKDSNKLSMYGFKQPLFPILLQARNISFHQPSVLKSATPQTFLDFCIIELKHQLQLENFEELLRARLDRGQCIVLVDGLDEVEEKGRAYFLEAYGAFQARYPGNYFVLTTRPTLRDRSEFELADTFTVRFMPLDPEKSSDYLAQNLGLTQQSDLGRKALSVIGIGTLAAFLLTPLALNIIAKLLESYRSPPDKLGDLINYYLEELIHKHEPSKGIQTPFTKKQIYRSLRDIAQHMESEKSDKISIITVEHILREQVSDSQAFITFLVERLNVMHETNPGIFSFSHQAYQDYFQKYPPDATVTMD